MGRVVGKEKALCIIPDLWTVRNEEGRGKKDERCTFTTC